MVCSMISDVNSLGDFLVYPTGCDYYFYLKILVSIFAVLTFILFNQENERFIKGDLISSLGVSATATIILGVIGTLVTNSAGIPMIQSDIFMYILAGCMVFIGIWLFKK